MIICITNHCKLSGSYLQPTFVIIGLGNKSLQCDSVKVYAFRAVSSVFVIPGTLPVAVNKVLSAGCLATLAECSPVSAAPLWEHTILG